MRIGSLALLWLACASAFCTAAEGGLAAGLTYLVEPTPNYRGAADAHQMVLTDGREANSLRRFWSQETTAGWKATRLVKVAIDLGATRNLGEVVLTVASGTNAGVRYPVASYAFVSEDQQNWVLGGCLRHVAPGAGVSGDGELRERLTLALGNQRGRFVRFYAVPAGDFFFTDEISVLPAKAGGAVASRPLRVANSDLEKTVDSLRHRDWSRYLAAVTDGPAAAKAFVECAGDPLEMPALHAASASRTGRLAGEAVGVKVEPCADDERITAGMGCAAKAVREHEWLRVGTRQYRAFRITARDGGRVRVAAHSRHGRVGAKLFEAKYVQALNGEYLADALRPVDGDLDVPGGMGSVVVLELAPTSAGQDQVELVLGSGENAWRHVYAIDALRLDEARSLRGNVWPYLDWPLLADRRAAAAADLARHGADVLVVPHRQLPLPGKGDDFSRLKETVKAFGKPRIVLLYLEMDRQGAGGRNPWLNSDKLAVWLRGAFQALDEVGVARDSVFLYPVDEPHGVALKTGEKFISLVRANHPEVRLYSTIGVPAALALLPYLDVAQALDKKGMAEAVKRQLRADQQLWLYKTDGPAKLNDPYAYYRLMGWRAFALGASGVGFWNYADTQRGGHAGDGWSDIASGRDFSVIYRGDKGDIVSGRRWEAFSLGLDDYQVLLAYQRIFGERKSRLVVSEVLDGKTPGQAERYRQQMLGEIAAHAARTQ